MNLDEATLARGGDAALPSSPAGTVVARCARRFVCAFQWCRGRAQALRRGPAVFAQGLDESPARPMTSRRLTRAEEINRLPWDEQLQVAQVASDKAKAKHARRTA